jgi:hypothetical protein
MATETVPAITEVAYNHGTEGPHDQLNRLSAQLESLLVTMTGEGFQNFLEHSTEVQENMLWMAYGMAHQMRMVSRQLDRAQECVHG